MVPGHVPDVRELPHDLRDAYLEQIEIQADPKLGEHLDRRASTGDLAAYHKVKFGHEHPAWTLAPDHLSASA